MRAAEDLQKAPADERAARAGIPRQMDGGVPGIALLNRVGRFQRRFRAGDRRALSANGLQFRPHRLPGAARCGDQPELERHVFTEFLAFLRIPAGDFLLVGSHRPLGLLAADAIDEAAPVGRVLGARVRKHRTVQDAVERVVVAGRNGVELVVVAARALDGESQEGLAEVVDGVFQSDVPLVEGLDPDAPGDRQVARGDRPLPTFLVVARVEQVSRDLLANELVVGFVVLEGIDDVVPVLVGFRHGKIARVPGSVRVANDVQPVASPALAVGRRRQQAVDEFRVSLRGIGCDEGLHLAGRRRQPGQVVGDPPDQGPLVGQGRRAQAFGFQLGQQETIDRVRFRIPADRLRCGGGGQGLERPVRAMRLADHVGLRERPLGLGPDQALIDPARDLRDVVRRQRAVGRHLDFVLVADHLQEQAGSRVSGHGSRAGLAPGEDGGAGIQAQLSLRQFGVATETAGFQDRANLVPEPLASLRRA